MGIQRVGLTFLSLVLTVTPIRPTSYRKLVLHNYPVFANLTHLDIVDHWMLWISTHRKPAPSDPDFDRVAVSMQRSRRFLVGAQKFECLPLLLILRSEMLANGSRWKGTL